MEFICLPLGETVVLIILGGLLWKLGDVAVDWSRGKAIQESKQEAERQKYEDLIGIVEQLYPKKKIEINSDNDLPPLHTGILAFDYHDLQTIHVRLKAAQVDVEKLKKEARTDYFRLIAGADKKRQGEGEFYSDNTPQRATNGRWYGQVPKFVIQSPESATVKELFILAVEEPIKRDNQMPIPGIRLFVHQFPEGESSGHLFSVNLGKEAEGDDGSQIYKGEMIHPRFGIPIANVTLRMAKKDKQ